MAYDVETTTDKADARLWASHDMATFMIEKIHRFIKGGPFAYDFEPVAIDGKFAARCKRCGMYVSVETN
tara:strand:- start:8908 stop:9114 length:207 start_codon:yes stop_codon:yes gene_type:complete